MSCRQLTTTPIRVGVCGYDLIGRRVADAVARQIDMRLVGVCGVDAPGRQIVRNLDRHPRLESLRYQMIISPQARA